MARDWEVVTLGDVADITVGYVGPMASEYVASGIPFLRSQNVERLRINDDDIKYISPEFHRRIRKSRLTPGDVVIVRTGKPGACSVIPEWLSEANCSDLVVVRCGTRLKSQFLAYFVNTVATGHVAAHLVGAVQQHFNVGAARSLQISLPSVGEQERITAMLTSLDNRIDYNRALIANLEGIARALFKSWFVDFDPVRAKAAGEAPPNLASDLAALFPDRLNDSELGGIPEGWTRRTVGDLADIVGGSTPSTKDESYWVDGQYHWATPKDLAGLSSPVLLRTERKITDAGLDQIGSGLLPPGTVLLSSRAPIGYLAIAAMPVAINQGFIAMKPKSGVSNLYLLYWAETSQEAIVANANGSTFLEISKKNFRPILAVDPGRNLMSAFSDVVKPMFDRVICAEQEIATLTEVRDLLLPRLISGRIRIEDADRTLEAA